MKATRASVPAGPRVVHAVPATGRLRLAVPAIRGRPARAAALERALASMPGVRGVSARPRTGSLVLLLAAARDAAGAAAAAPALVARALALAEAAGAPAPAGAAPRRPAGAATPAFPDAPAMPGRAPAGRAGPAPSRAWWHESAEATLRALASDGEAGLDEAEVARRLARHGPNRRPRDAPPSPLALLAGQFASLPVAMLAASAAVSLASGGARDAVATLAVVVVNAVIGFATEREAERVIGTLTGGPALPVAVRRGGQALRVPAERLVPGDLLDLGPGMTVAADARLVAAVGLGLDESTLTGESLPAAKRAAPPAPADAPLADRHTMLHAGTIVSQGTGRAVVVATAGATEIALTEALSGQAMRPRAPVEAALDRLGGRLVVASLAACALFAVIGALRGYPPATVLRDALALAVAAVPEGLPMVATTTLSIGLRKMARKGILVRTVHAAESLGAVEIVCLDKTGTLTENRLAVVAAETADGPVSPRDAAAFAPLAEIAALNNEAEPGPAGPEGSSSTERALLAAALAAGLDVDALRRARPRIATVEREPGRPWMATRHAGDGWPVLYKGAPATLLEASDRAMSGGRPVALGQGRRRAIEAANERLAARPSRVLGLAMGERAPGDDGALPGDLVFAGLVAMEDPIRADAPRFVRRLHRAGIRTVLITGDQAATAGAIARALDLGHGAPLRVMEAADLAALDPALLQGLARDVHVFARVASHQKLAIVQALQAGGHTVAMTGDGVNDGPALNAADVGIAMGRSGSDLAREVANVVVRDDRLDTLVDAIAEGRGLYRNIRRALEFLVTTNLSEIAVSIVEALHGPGELETPMELLWINMVSDVLPGLGLALAAPDRDVLERPPRARDEPIVPPGDLRRMGLDSGLIAASVLGAHFVGMARHGPGPETRGMTFLALSQAQLLYTLVCQRSDPRHLAPARLLENRPLDLALVASSALGALPFLHPWLRRLLGIAPLGGRDLAVSLGAAALPFAAVLARRGVTLALEERETTP